MWALTLSLVVLATLHVSSVSPVSPRSMTVRLFTVAGIVNSVNDLEIAAEVTNTGSEDLKLLKDGTILDGSGYTRAFFVIQDGQDVPFAGLNAQISLSGANADAFMVIPRGQSVIVNHKTIGSSFDFHSMGDGNFSFAPAIDFQIITRSHSETTMERLTLRDSEFNTVHIVVRHTSTSHGGHSIAKRAGITHPDPSKQTFIETSYKEAKILAYLAIAFSNDALAGPSFYTYFKDNNRTVLKETYLGIRDETGGVPEISYADPHHKCFPGVISYTDYSTKNIHVCPPFFQEPATHELCNGTSLDVTLTRSGRLFRELIHVARPTLDVVSGCLLSRQLPAEASLLNADNYACYALQAYAYFVC
ncbi:hypothetical protein HGRIS_011355 [Hohenbuehelia grisea]|uniref:Lysine-specific metallo-endopeptidase domain-containing protein n=1 Tax=Hohenbuehelia grisea TaxID=104357 RepID=A0ABR3JW76_9AGAR